MKTYIVANALKHAVPHIYTRDCAPPKKKEMLKLTTERLKLLGKPYNTKKRLKFYRMSSTGLPRARKVTKYK